MDRSSTNDAPVLPGAGILLLCVILLLAGYVAAGLRPTGSAAVTEETVPSAL
jgi:hypothetical protein